MGGNGGPAFPVLNIAAEPGYSGMSLRDYFAGQAMSVLLGARMTLAWNGKVLDDENKIAHVAYLLADAMLAEHERPMRDPLSRAESRAEQGEA